MVCLSCVTVFAAKDKVLTEDQVASYKSAASKMIEKIMDFLMKIFRSIWIRMMILLQQP